MAPQIVPMVEDRKPKATLFLLRQLEGQVNDPNLKGQISQLIKFIKDKTIGVH